MKRRDLWKAEHYCHRCNTRMKRKTMQIEGFKVRSWGCAKCGETVLHPEDAQKMLIFNKLKRGLLVKIGKLGSSLIIRFPKEFIDFYNINKGEKVTLKAGNKEKLEIEISD